MSTTPKQQLSQPPLLPHPHFPHLSLPPHHHHHHVRVLKHSISDPKQRQKQKQGQSLRVVHIPKSDAISVSAIEEAPDSESQGFFEDFRHFGIDGVAMRDQKGNERRRYMIASINNGNAQITTKKSGLFNQSTLRLSRRTSQKDEQQILDFSNMLRMKQKQLLQECCCKQEKCERCNMRKSAEQDAGLIINNKKIKVLEKCIKRCVDVCKESRVLVHQQIVRYKEDAQKIYKIYKKLIDQQIRQINIKILKANELKSSNNQSSNINSNSNIQGNQLRTSITTSTAQNQQQQQQMNSQRQKFKNQIKQLKEKLVKIQKDKQKNQKQKEKLLIEVTQLKKINKQVSQELINHKIKFQSLQTDLVNQKSQAQLLKQQIKQLQVKTQVPDSQISKLSPLQIQHQLQMQYKKESQLIKNLNKQIKQTNEQLTQYKQENKKYKQKIKEYQIQKKLFLKEIEQIRGRTEDSQMVSSIVGSASKLVQNKAQPSREKDIDKYKKKIKQNPRQFPSAQRSQKSHKGKQHNIQVFHQFLDSIQLLEKELNELKKSASPLSIEDSQFVQYKNQIKQQLQQIDEFLYVCDEREKGLDFRQMNLVAREEEVQRGYEEVQRGMDEFMRGVQDVRRRQMELAEIQEVLIAKEREIEEFQIRVQQEQIQRQRQMEMQMQLQTQRQRERQIFYSQRNVPLQSFKRQLQPQPIQVHNTLPTQTSFTTSTNLSPKKQRPKPKSFTHAGSLSERLFKCSPKGRQMCSQVQTSTYIPTRSSYNLIHQRRSSYQPSFFTPKASTPTEQYQQIPSNQAPPQTHTSQLSGSVSISTPPKTSYLNSNTNSNLGYANVNINGGANSGGNVNYIRGLANGNLGSKYSSNNNITNRLSKIQSSIVSQLNSLGFRK